MQGLLSNRLGIRINRTRVGQSLARVASDAHLFRTRTLYKVMNPVLYTAAYFGEKLPCDQNEKLVPFGAIHVLAIDGFSPKGRGVHNNPGEECCSIYERISSAPHFYRFI